METVVQVPESQEPSTMSEVLAALKKENLDPRHEAKSWGDWIHLAGFRTVISIDANRGLASSATIEHAEDEEDGTPGSAILRAFGRLGWVGLDEEGEFSLGS